MQNEITVPILVGDKYRKYPRETSKQQRTYGIYKCYCGVEFEAQSTDIKSGHTKSCGCLWLSSITTHGMRSHPLYNSWDSMIQRCTNKNNKHYSNYGGRGIKVCSDWIKPDGFIKDMYGSWEEGLSIDRIDVDGDYTASNCRWANQYTQTRNTRQIQINNTSGYRGVYKSSSKWTARITVDYKYITIGTYDTKEDGAIAFNNYVLLNNLDHNLNDVVLKLPAKLT